MMRVVTLGFGVALLVAGCDGQRSGAECVPVAAGQDDVAYLAVVEGQVTIRRAGGPAEPARQDMSLSRADTVITGPDATAIVVLANCHVLRLAEGQETPVGKLAQLDGPPPSRGFSQLFADALGSDDFSRIGGAERLERIAGWNARRASGETPAPVSAPAAAPPPVQPEKPAEEPRIEGRVLDSPEPIEEAPGGGVRKDAPQTDSKRAPQAEKGKGTASPAKPIKKSEPRGLPTDVSQGDTPPEVGESKSPAPGGRAEGSKEETERAPDLADGWIFETGDNRQVQKASLPAPLADRRAALARCVADARSGVAAPQLRLRVEGGAVKELKVDGGSAPACAKDVVGLRVPGVDDGWMLVRVKR